MTGYSDPWRGPRPLPEGPLFGELSEFSIRRGARGGLSRGGRRKAALVRRDGDLCAYCKRPPDLLHKPPTIDHVVPVSRGGTDAQTNLVIACRTCNHDKADRLVGEWVDRWYVGMTGEEALAFEVETAESHKRRRQQRMARLLNRKSSETMRSRP